MGLLGVLAIEEKFDLLISNYKDFERQLLNVSLHSLLHHDRNDRWWREQVRDAIRHLANTLSIARLYRDQTCHALGRLPVSNNAELRREFDRQGKMQFDSRFSFRFLEELRNLIQHRALYAETFILPSKWEEMPDEESGQLGRLSFRSDLLLDLDAVLAEEKLKPRVREELTEMRVPNKSGLGVRGYLREYISAWFCVHRRLRELLSDSIAQWDSLWDGTRTRAKELDQGPGLAVVMYSDDSRAGERVFWVGEKLQTERRRLEARNSLLEHLSRQYVTGRALPGEQHS